MPYDSVFNYRTALTLLILNHADFNSLEFFQIHFHARTPTSAPTHELLRNLDLQVTACQVRHFAYTCR